MLCFYATLFSITITITITISTTKTIPITITMSMSISISMSITTSTSNPLNNKIAFNMYFAFNIKNRFKGKFFEKK